MTGRLLALITTAAMAVFLAVAGIAAISGAASACMLPPSSGSASGYNAEQLHNAGLIVEVANQRGLPIRAAVIAVATAMQESRLYNLGNLGEDNDHDSLGLFQQRPSKGWGTPEQIMNSEYAAGKFYDKLLTVANWQTLPLTQVAQAVQRSAYPDAYAKHQADATAIVAAAAAHVGSGNSRAFPEDLDLCVSTDEWVQPVRASVVSGFRTATRPGHDGVDLGARRGTPILVASAGTVLIVRCNVEPASHGCNRDGSPATPGCGWYVDVLHSGDVITRYCHMLTRPIVVVRQRVATGQVIGYVGSSGHSSGPHLHFEVHLNHDRSAGGAVDPVEFMAGRAPIR